MIQGSRGDTAELTVQGMSVSPGVACGTVFLLKTDEEPVVSRTLPPDGIAEELARLTTALDATREQIQRIQRNAREHIGLYDARIFDVHLMVLDDHVFIDEIREDIRAHCHNAEHAVWTVSSRYVDALSRIQDDYLRERQVDIKDVTRRLLRCLGGRHAPTLEIPPGSIVVADSLTPSDTALLRHELAAGLACDFGSPVSHAAIMARALEIPAVVALHDITARVVPGETLLIDGNHGVVYIRPTAERMKTFEALMDRRHRLRVKLVKHAQDIPAIMTDEVPVALRANIDVPGDLDDVVKYGGDGIGLFRSENIFLKDGRYAGEQAQIAVYRALVERMHPRPVIVRTLDLGGDKLLPDMPVAKEDNPFLGCRGLRFCLLESDAFKIQLRAIARVAAEGNLKIMYPMVSDIDELLRANDFLREVCAAADLAMPPVGAMIETPAAAVCADAIAAHVDFISIGTNDLIQYAMAADRGNDLVSYLFQPAHPAILRLIKTAVDAAAAAGVPVGLCGEMAGDPLLVPLLIGLGVTDLSMVASTIPLVKMVVRALGMAEARTLAAEAVGSRSGKDVLQHCRAWLQQRVPDVYELIG